MEKRNNPGMSGTKSAIMRRMRGVVRLAVPPFFLLLLAAGCFPLEKHVELTYERLATSRSASGEVFVAHPTVKQPLTALPGGRQVLGKAGDTDIVIEKSPEDWLLSAFVEELSAAGYNVRTVAALPPGASKAVVPAILALSARQTSEVLIVTTFAEVKLEAQLWRHGQLLKTLTVSASDQEEGMDRSSEPVRRALEKALQSAMGELLPGIVEGLD